MDIKDRIFLGKIIKAARERRELTQEALADKLHVTKQAISNWERGETGIDAGIQKTLEKVLGITLEEKKTDPIVSVFPKFHLSELKTITNMEQVESAVDTLLSSVDLDSAFEVTVQRMLRRLLYAVLGFEIYFLGHIKKEYEEYPIDWECISSELRDIVDKRESYPIPKGYECPSHFQEGLLSQKIEYMAFMIGYGLFEDFNDEGYRNNFEQQIGRRGEADAKELVNIIPPQDNSFIMSFRAAVYSLANQVDRFS